MELRAVAQLDPRLGRQLVHDPRSREFEFRPRGAAPERTIQHRIYGPRPVPEQIVGCCTGVDQVVKCDAAGNRIRGTVLGMLDAIRVYSLATRYDPWPGEYPQTDTGSSALGACKAAKQLGLIERYEWIFSGPDGIIAALPERPVGVGTWWYADMFEPDAKTFLVRPGGRKVGGHQWTVIGYEPATDFFRGYCWWGPTFGRNGMFRIHRDALAELLADGGDAHVTYRAGATG